jgi:ribosomal protein S18 acetylase RimI-like enzyme
MHIGSTAAATNFICRPATSDDAAVLAELIYLAGQSQYSNSAYDLSLGGSRNEQLNQIEKLTTTESRSWFHYLHFDVAEADGQVVAGAAGFDRITADENIPGALREIGWLEEAIANLDKRLEKVYACFPPEPSGYWTLDHIAVLPAWRHKGLARRTITRALERGRLQGCHHAKLDLFAGNIAALALYESLGFQWSETFGASVLPEMLGRDALERMILRL